MTKDEFSTGQHIADRRVPRTPPALNVAAPAVVAPVATGQGVCINQNPLGNVNRDATGLRTVKRGCVVEFPGGATVRVARVRKGHFYPDVFLRGDSHPTLCAFVRVVA